MRETTKATSSAQPTSEPEASADEAIAHILSAWIRSERAFQRSHVWPIETPIKGVSLDRVDYAIFRELFHGGPRRLSDLAKLTNMSGSHASRVVDTLVRCNLLSRTTPDGDRRVTIIDLSPDGRALISDIEGRFLELVRARISAFSSSDISKFAELFGRFADQVVEWVGDIAEVGLGKPDSADPQSDLSPATPANQAAQP